MGEMRRKGGGKGEETGGEDRQKCHHTERRSSGADLRGSGGEDERLRMMRVAREARVARVARTGRLIGSHGSPPPPPAPAPPAPAAPPAPGSRTRSRPRTRAARRPADPSAMAQSTAPAAAPRKIFYDPGELFDSVRECSGWGMTR